MSNMVFSGSGLGANRRAHVFRSLRGIRDHSKDIRSGFRLLAGLSEPRAAYKLASNHSKISSQNSILSQIKLAYTHVHRNTTPALHRHSPRCLPSTPLARRQLPQHRAQPLHALLQVLI